MHRAVRILSTALITAGCVMLVDVGLTLVWTEPVSALYGEIRQSQAEDELDELTEELAAAESLNRRDFGAQARRLAERTGEGDAIGRIRIGRTATDLVIVEGTDTSSLQIGPGHYSTTALPGQGRSVGIAGHRTTYGAPFNELDELEAGDEIELEMPYGEFVYEVTETRIVTPDQTEVLDDTESERIVLTACHPLYSAAERIVVSGRLRESSPA